MELEHIKELLDTVCEYNTVNITQIFSKDDIEWISVRCIPSTCTLEFTYLQEDKTELYDSVPEAANVILKQTQSDVTA